MVCVESDNKLVQVKVLEPVYISDINGMEKETSTNCPAKQVLDMTVTFDAPNVSLAYPLRPFFAIDIGKMRESGEIFGFLVYISKRFICI